MTRASRQIGSIIPTCKILKKEHENKKNTRKLQNVIGNKLSHALVKTQPNMKLSSGHGGFRTWIALPKLFGLCYIDHNEKMQFTDNGKTVAKGGKEANKVMEIHANELGVGQPIIFATCGVVSMELRPKPG